MHISYSENLRAATKSLANMDQSERSAYIESLTLSQTEVKSLKLTYLKAYTTNDSTSGGNWY